MPRWPGKSWNATLDWVSRRYERKCEASAEMEMGVGVSKDGFEVHTGFLLETL